MLEVPDEGRVNVMLKPELSRRIKFGTLLWSERFLNLVHRKTLTNYNDGTFCWGG